MVSRSAWAVAIVLAVALHATLIFAFVHNAKDQAGAKDKGVNGVEVNLGVLGNMGDKKPIKKLKPKPKPKPKKKTVKKKRKLKPKPKVREVVKPLQTTEVVVKEVVPLKVVETITQKPMTIVEAPKQPVNEPIQEQPESAASSSEEVYKKTTGIGQEATKGGVVAKRIAYSGQVFAKIKKYKRYPRFSKRRHEEGIVKLSFTLDKTGKVLRYKIVESSGYERLDKEVIRMLKKASPFPPFPKDMMQDILEITAPVSFFLK